MHTFGLHTIVVTARRGLPSDAPVVVLSYGPNRRMEGTSCLGADSGTMLSMSESV